MKMLIITLSLALTALVAECTVLDPALYLAPSPPLMLTSDSIPPEELWLQTLETRLERAARDVVKSVTDIPEPVETARMFWPRFSAPQPTLGINIPMTFRLSGTYGKSALSPAGVIGNTYTSITGIGTSLGGLMSKTTVGTLEALGSTAGYGNYGRSAFAGSGYGTYGAAPSVRVYGSDGAASWSGWGNGKWGHYGKG